MAKRNDPQRESQSTDAGNPQQFRLMDLFALMTLVALVSAMAAPLLRGLESDYRNRLFLVLGLQLLFTTGMVSYYAGKRKKLLDKAGLKIGSAFCGQSRWQHWPVVMAFLIVLFRCISLLLFAAVIALLLARNLPGPVTSVLDRLPVSHRILHYLHYFSFLDYLFYALFPWSVGYTLSLYRWRAYPNSIEFFEHGIVKKGLSFIPWQHIEVRPSSFFPDKIAIVLRASKWAIADQASPDFLDSKDSIAGTITMAQVTGKLRERVFAVANSVHQHELDDGA